MKRCSIRKADNGKLTSSGGTIAQETRSISITWESYAIIKNHQSLDFCCDTFNRIQVVEYMNDINHILYIIEWYWMLAYKMTSGLLGFRYASQILVTHVFQTFNLRLPRNRKKGRSERSDSKTRKYNSRASQHHEVTAFGHHTMQKAHMLSTKHGVNHPMNPSIISNRHDKKYSWFQFTFQTSKWEGFLKW